MTSGVLMFAFDDPLISYTDMAAWNAKRVHQWLDLPVTLVTDKPCDHTVFDQIILHSRPESSALRWRDRQAGVMWTNQDRCAAYHLSPYDHTVLMDADYIINSTDLLPLLAADYPLMCFRHAHDIATGLTLAEHDSFGMYQMPMWWATVVVFRRSRESSLIFDAWHMIQTHWDHYRNIYHIDRPMFRNDFALSIALCLVAGHNEWVYDIPWSMPTIMPGTHITQHDPDIVLTYQDHQQRTRRQQFRDSDFHAMDKFALGEIIAGSA